MFIITFANIIIAPWQRQHNARKSWLQIMIIYRKWPSKIASVLPWRQLRRASHESIAEQPARPTTTFTNWQRSGSDDEATMVLHACKRSRRYHRRSQPCFFFHTRRCLMSELHRPPTKSRPAAGRRRTLLRRRCRVNHNQKRISLSI